MKSGHPSQLPLLSIPPHPRAPPSWPKPRSTSNKTSSPKRGRAHTPSPSPSLPSFPALIDETSPFKAHKAHKVSTQNPFSLVHLASFAFLAVVLVSTSPSHHFYSAISTENYSLEENNSDEILLTFDVERSYSSYSQTLRLCSLETDDPTLQHPILLRRTSKRESASHHTLFPPNHPFQDRTQWRSRPKQSGSPRSSNLRTRKSTRTWQSSYIR
jgi:hypothetical protein